MQSEPLQSSLPANKTMVPCYFFFNGFCNKGNRCSFSHGADDSFPTVKPVKNDNGSINALNLENKTVSRNKTGVASTPNETTLVNQSLSTTKALSDFKLKPKEDLQLPLPENVKQQGASLELSSFDDKEAAITRSDSLFQDDAFAHNMSPLCTEQSSEEQVNSHIEPEERWESSPGFDVLVHDESGNLGYENDSEYLPVLDVDDQELDEQYSGYEYKDPVEYDTMCSDADILYEQGRYDDYRCFGRDFTNANGGEVCAYPREIILDSILSRKRIRMSGEVAAGDNNLDLRNHLRRRRESSGPPESSSLMVGNHERHQRYGIDQHRSRRLTSQLGFSSFREVENLSIANKHRFFMHSQQNRPRKHYREKPAKRSYLSPKISRKPVFKQQRSVQESTTFSGPKTLAEIKEEKKKVEEKSLCASSSAKF